MKRRMACLLVFLAAGAVFSSAGFAELTTQEATRLEADYILSCQYLQDGSGANGAINNVYGDPTWVVPGENAVAIMGLLAASEALGDDVYRQRAQLAGDYLVRMQNTSDGAWYDQYSYDASVTAARSTRQTAQVMMALDKLGYDPARYAAMKKGAEFLMNTQNVAYKGGQDDGLVAGGKNEDGEYHTWRWASDNAYAYQAFKAASAWAAANGDTAFAVQAGQAADKVAEGINLVLFSAEGTHWVRVIDKDGIPVAGQDYADWISYAPLMLDVPLTGGISDDVSEWIHETLQKTNGALAWDDAAESDRMSPGYSFQAALVWLDADKLGYVDSAVAWAEDSGLWNLDSGGWVDWLEESGGSAQGWERFIDTSAYYIMIKNNGYDFNADTVVPEPASLALFVLGGGLFWQKKRRVL
ncbi:MAG: PEP-CTERM sorting domain-containing protein [Candidatus Omnitrophica bacterium]|nr:PEP-CTERM sorting domain-containing protein [Candidatus Omnitrophota bacterium]MDD5574543.1 PEP-CTERM sorting domain-containing protein [Candidatus Omnitrophota bacterium]